MKFFTIIFSIYITVLSFAPCKDSIEDNHSTQTNQSSNNHKQTKDNCTPFCICACCGKQLVAESNSPVFKYLLKLEKSDKGLTLFNQSFSSLYIASIWQPPKIS